MCGCVAHYDKDTPCTCRCPEHATKLKLVDPATTVTLRPDNPDDVKRLADALDSLSTAGAWTASDAVAAMRSLLPPSGPPEPNGLGAVVEGFAGRDGVKVEWVRAIHDGGPAKWAISLPVPPNDVERWWLWSAMHITAVLSHGVGCTCGGPGCPGGEDA